MGIMRKPIKRINYFLGGKESGQAVVEYLLMVVVAISIVAVMGTSFRKTLIGIWGFYIRQISAACPGCTPNPGYRFR
jgi:Flp pilus assembly pilin Flp